MQEGGGFLPSEGRGQVGQKEGEDFLVEREGERAHEAKRVAHRKKIQHWALEIKGGKWRGHWSLLFDEQESADRRK